MQKPDPELLPIQRPRCPKCQMRMVTIWSRPETDGMELRGFECLRCGNAAARHMVADPIKSGEAVGWISGELGKLH